MPSHAFSTKHRAGESCSHVREKKYLSNGTSFRIIHGFDFTARCLTVHLFCEHLYKGLRISDMFSILLMCSKYLLTANLLILWLCLDHGLNLANPTKKRVVSSLDHSNKLKWSKV
jgi:hypothetical protein